MQIPAGNISEPKAYVAQNNNQYAFDVDCIYLNNQKLEFEANNTLGGCLVLAPYIIDQKTADPIGAAFWVSEKAKDGNFAKLYMFNETSEYFEEVYNNQMPLGLYKGRLIGPIRIWQVNYPEWAQTNETLYERHLYG